MRTTLAGIRPAVTVLLICANALSVLLTAIVLFYLLTDASVVVHSPYAVVLWCLGVWGASLLMLRVPLVYLMPWRPSAGVRAQAVAANVALMLFAVLVLWIEKADRVSIGLFMAPPVINVAGIFLCGARPVETKVCAMCGYDLSGSSGERCPECGMTLR